MNIQSNKSYINNKKLHYEKERNITKRNCF